jgi:predicted phosphodiesterase
MHSRSALDDVTIAIISDVHGNRWALEAVLEDIDRRGVRDVVNLGDSLYGPLDPAGTARLLRGTAPLSIRGNQDRAILEPGAESGWPATMRYVMRSIDSGDIEWLGGHVPVAYVAAGRVLLCHGTPAHDDVCLVERITPHGVALHSPEELASGLKAVSAEVVSCGHSHVPRLLRAADGRLVVNPGSVGLPSYSDDAPYPHAMEAGSPHARYALLSASGEGWHVTHVALTYDWQHAASEAERNGRSDWAEWLRSGRAEP